MQPTFLLSVSPHFCKVILLCSSGWIYVPGESDMEAHRTLFILPQPK